MRRAAGILSGILLGVSSAGGLATAGAEPEVLMNDIAGRYVRLVLDVGRLDPNFVDAYYGPAEWRAAAAEGEPKAAADLLQAARALRERVLELPGTARGRFLEKQLAAVEGFLRKQSGERIPLAEEARLLYDVDTPPAGTGALEEALAEIERLVPGEGDLSARVQAFRADFQVPTGRLAAVVDAALAETRRRTRALVQLPEQESFRVAYVTGQPWGAYNWYEGGYASLIEVNTDLPAEIGGIVDTLAHEGYPGHHAYSVLLEDRLVRGRGWIEYSVYPLYSPQSLLAEGTANLALSVVMTDAERLAFLRDVLAPLAGLEGLDFERYDRLLRATQALRHVRGEAARMLLDEGRTESEVEAFLVRYGLMDAARARKSMEFARAYGAYVYTYSVGRDRVGAWIGEGADRTERFFRLLQEPFVPSDLSGPDPR